MDYVPQLVEREALTHRFFLSFSYDPSMKAPDHTPEAIAAVLNEKAEVARRYLDRCGVAVLEPEYADNFILELFYKLINKHTSQHLRLPDGVFDMLGMVHGVYDEEALKRWTRRPRKAPGKRNGKVFPKGGNPRSPVWRPGAHHHSGSDRAARHRYAPSRLSADRRGMPRLSLHQRLWLLDRCRQRLAHPPD